MVKWNTTNSGMFSVVVISAKCENASCFFPFCTLKVATTTTTITTITTTTTTTTTTAAAATKQHDLLYQHHLNTYFNHHSVEGFVTSSGATVISERRS
jgi:hypothetical protein